MKEIGVTVMGIVVLSIFAQVWVSGQVKKGDETTLIGSWDLQVTLRDCDSGFPFVTFPAMNTYDQGGTMQQTAIPEAGVTSLPGHGVWNHDTSRDYSAAFRFLSLDPNPALTRRIIVRSSINLDLGGKSYTSTDAAEILTLNGDVIARGCSTTSAIRFE